VAHVAHRQAQLLRDPRRPELREEHGSRAVLAVPRGACLGERRRPPAVRAASVQLVLEHEEAGALEDGDPVLRRALQLPALVVALAGRNADEQAALARQHAMQLAQRGFVSFFLARRIDVVHLVVAPDVLERRDAEDQLERSIGERQRPHVADDGPQSRDVGSRQVGAREVGRTERDQSRQVCRLGERVADVEHPRLTVVAREAPRDLDRTLVTRRGSAQIARPRRAAHLARTGTLGRRERERIVEQLDPAELLARGELPQEPGARERPVPELAERSGACLRLG